MDTDMKRNTLAWRVICLALSALLLLGATVGCSAPLDDDENPPAQMRCASAPGVMYRLFLPADWSLTVDAGFSGGYYSLDDSATITAVTYPNTDPVRTLTDFWGEVMQPQLNDFFGGDLTEEDEKPVETVLGQSNGEGEEAVNYAVPAVAVRYGGILGHLEYRGMAVLASFEEKILVLTYHARADVYDTYLPAMEAAVKNFRWLGKPYVPEDPVHTVDSTAAAPDGMKLASNSDVAYYFYVPDSWSCDTKLPTSAAYLPADRSNVTVTVYMPEEDTLTAEQYWEMCLADWRGEKAEEAIIRDLEVLSDTTGELDGRPSHTYVFRGKVAGKTYHFSQTVAAYRGMVYTLTYTATEEAFDAHLDDVARMIEHFDFRGN